MNAIYTAVGTNEYADTTGTGAISERNESESAHHHQSNFGELKLNGQFEYRLKMGDLIKFASFQLSEVNQVAFKATEKTSPPFQMRANILHTYMYEAGVN